MLYKSFLKAIKRGLTTSLVVIKPLKVQKSELEWFDKLPKSDVDKKILFTMYVLCRIRDNQEFAEYLNFYNNFGQFRKDANISDNVNMNTKVKQFRNEGLIRVTDNNAYQILYLNKVPREGAPFYLTDFL